MMFYIANFNVVIVYLYMRNCKVPIVVLNENVRRTENYLKLSRMMKYSVLTFIRLYMYVKLFKLNIHKYTITNLCVLLRMRTAFNVF